MPTTKTSTSSNRLAPLTLAKPTVSTDWFEEPRLLFANGMSHCDPKVGIPLYALARTIPTVTSAKSTSVSSERPKLLITRERSMSNLRKGSPATRIIHHSRAARLTEVFGAI